MLSSTTFVEILLASLPLWQVAVAMLEPGLAANHRFNQKKELFQRHLHQHEKRAASASSSFAASSSYSSSSYVPSWPASSTFDVTPVNSASYSGSGFLGPTPTPVLCGSEDCKFYSSETAPYFIHKWPGVDFETGEFYGGLTPINESAPHRALFWIFKPKQGEPVDEVTIWLNGGPGCSSLEGFLQENGPISWQPGQFHPSYNPFHWATLTNMIWVEQPVGTGYSTGLSGARNEYDVADDFIGFIKNWQKLFGIKNYKIYMTGESYAGLYIPYISAGMLDQKDKTYFDLSGALMYDPCIGDCGTVQNYIPTNQFAINNQVILNLNQSTLNEMAKLSSTCGIDAYMEKYLQFPPPGHQPTDHEIYKATKDCNDVYNWYINEVVNKNACFDVYHIINWCPTPTNIIREYFDRLDVQKAIHAPLHTVWLECTAGAFVNAEDHSPWSIEAALPQVIEATNRVLVSNGDWDALIYTNGTLLAIQNMTWNGKLGFQEKPCKNFEVPLAIDEYGFHYGPQGVMGIAHYERGLMWVETYQAGHMQPQFQPRAALRQLQWLLGRIDTLWE